MRSIMQYFISLPVAFMFFFGVGSVCSSASADLGDYPKFAGYILESHSRVDSVSESFMYKEQGGPSSIRLRRAVNVDAKAAAAIINNEILAIQAVYSRALAPYPDAISNSIEFDRSMIPRLEEATINGVSVKFYSTRLSLSKAHGVQSANDVFYKGVLAWAFCSKQREAQTFEVIVPSAQFSDKYKQFVLHAICSSSH